MGCLIVNAFLFRWYNHKRNEVNYRLHRDEPCNKASACTDFSVEKP